jgi:membrane protein required for colicin V production
MTIFDYVVIGVVAVSLLMGLLRGVVGEMIALAAWLLAAWSASQFNGLVAQWLFQGIADSSLRTLAACVTIFVGVLVLMALVRMAVKSLIRALGLSLSDRLLGALFGLARGGLICMLLVALGGMTSAPQQPWWENSTLSAPLETAVMAAKTWLPEDLAKRIRFS